MHQFVLLTGMRYGNATQITRDMIVGDWVECPAAIMKSRRPWRFPITKQLRQVIDKALAHSTHDLLFATYSAKQPGKVIPIPNCREKHPFLADRVGHQIRRHYRTAVALCDVPPNFADLLLDHAPQHVMAGVYINDRDLDDRLRSFAQKVEDSIMGGIS
jgi:integrase